MKTYTPKPEAPEPQLVTTGFYITYEEIRWYIKYYIFIIKEFFYNR